MEHIEGFDRGNRTEDDMDWQEWRDAVSGNDVSSAQLSNAGAAPVAVAAATAVAADGAFLQTSASCLDTAHDLVRSLDVGALDDAQLIDAIAALEHLKGAASAAQSRLEVAFRNSQIRAQKNAGVPREKLGKGIADQIALARRITPKQASDQLALRRVLVETMPRTTRLLDEGEISEWGALQVAQACLVLDDEDRDRVDADLEAVLPEMTAQRAGGTARALANSLDPVAAVKRARRAVSDRHVSLRPAPDGMSLLSALVPVQQGVACLAALDAHARRLRACGDQRSKGGVMADSLVERVTGLVRAEDVGIEVHLLMTDTTLLGGADEAASLQGHPIPGSIARHLALGIPEAARQGETPSDLESLKSTDRRFLRRLFTNPATGTLSGIDATRRTFTGTLRRFILARDQDCRTPWCDSPIRHIDHARRHADGGATDAHNGIGHCERFNQVKEMPGWRSELGPATGHGDRGAAPSPGGTRPPGVLHIITPTGHSYVSTPPVLRRPPTTGGDRGDGEGGGGESGGGESGGSDAGGDAGGDHETVRNEE